MAETSKGERAPERATVDQTPDPSDITVNIMAPAAAAKPIIFFGSIAVPGIDGILLARSVAGARSISSGSGV